MNINQIIAYFFYLALMGIGGYATKVWKEHNKAILELKQKEEERAVQILGQQTTDRAKKIVSDAVYEFEQLGKENDWEGDLKHSKVLDFVEGKLKDLSEGKIILTDDDIFDVIKTTVGMINANKVSQTAPQVINPTGQITNTIE